MPELPEVEVVCRGLRSFLIGRTITALRWSGKALRHPLDLEAMQHTLINQKITAIERRAKFLQISLDLGAMLIIHLGMTGKLGSNRQRFCNREIARLHHGPCVIQVGNQLSLGQVRPCH